MHVHGGDDILYKTVCNFYLKRHIVFCLTCFFFLSPFFSRSHNQLGYTALGSFRTEKNERFFDAIDNAA